MTNGNGAPVETPPVVPVTNGNGVTTNGNGTSAAAVAEEKTYFGFTPMQLMLGAVGFGALYFLVLKK